MTDPSAGAPAQRHDWPHTIEFVEDTEHPFGTMLLMDSVRQSYVDLDDPTYLDFEYVQYLASALATIPDGPIAITHVGGGALTLPRYIEAIRPGSTQIVLEPDTELTELVRKRLPLPRNHSIRIRPVDGRTGVAALAAASADVVILDAYADGQVPPELTTVEFFADVARVLRGDGLLLANVVDEPGLQYIARVVAGMRSIFADVALVASSDVLRGRRFGNVVLVAGRSALDVDELRRQIARQPFPAGVRHGEQLDQRFATARPFTGEDVATSPEPFRDGWRVR